MLKSKIAEEPGLKTDFQKIFGMFLRTFETRKKSVDAIPSSLKKIGLGSLSVTSQWYDEDGQWPLVTIRWCHGTATPM